MKKIIKNWGILFLFFSIIFSCKKQEKMPMPQSESQQSNVTSDELILGKRLTNPYSVTNMEQAYTNISSASNKRQSADNPVKVTHYYIMFLPKDWKEYDLLKSDLNLKLYDYPLDYEIVSRGSRTYHDKSIPANLPTWQYTAIPVNYNYNQSIKSEILEKLYIPELDSTLQTYSSNQRKGGKSLIDVLVDEAMIITHNYTDTLKSHNSADQIAWDPSGVVKVYDTRLKTLIPLGGVKMRARRWFDIRETFTNNEGYYRISGFKREANYALFFESNDFDVRTGTFGQAWIDGPKQDSPWNVDLYGIDQFYAHVFRGGVRYHYGEVYGLRRPQWAGFRIKYAAYNKEGKAQGINIGNWTMWGVNPNILIYRYETGTQEYDSDEIFSSTIHETCHSTHWSLMNGGPIQFAQVSTIIRESWPIAVEWFITGNEYRSRGISNYGTENYYVDASFPLDRAYQYWNKSRSTDYTSLFIDLLDNFNQVNWSSDYPNDQVIGYSLSGIESGFLKHVYGVSSLSSQLKNNKPAGLSDAKIDQLLSSY